MLARRIIPVILYRGAETFKGEQFNSWRRVGNLRQAVRVYQSRNVDELILLDISGNSPDIALIRDLGAECFMPLTVGGGVRTMDQVASLIANGADKVLLNTAAVETPELITQASVKFGRQAVVVGLDIRNGTTWIESGTRDTGFEPRVAAVAATSLGAGELIATTIDRDGTMAGYDLDSVRQMANAVAIPVIANGGAGTYEHMRQALDAGAHGVAAGAIWSFTDCTPSRAAEYLARHGYPVRRYRAA